MSTTVVIIHPMKQFLDFIIHFVQGIKPLVEGKGRALGLELIPVYKQRARTVDDF